MICPSCGKENPDDAASCIRCGAIFSGAPQPPEQPGQVPVPPLPPIPQMTPEYMGAPSPPGEQWWQSLWFSIVLAFLGLCCCPFSVAGIALYWTNPIASKQNKIIFTVIVAAILLFGILINVALLPTIMKESGHRTPGTPF